MGNNLMYVNIFVSHCMKGKKMIHVNSLLFVYIRIEIMTVNACH